MSMQCGYFKPQSLEELSLRLSRLHHHLPFEVGKVAARSCERLRLLAEWTWRLILCVQINVTMLDPGKIAANSVVFNCSQGCVSSSWQELVRKAGCPWLHTRLALHSTAYMIRLPFVSLLRSICFNVLPFAAGIHCNFAHSQEQIGEETRRYSYLFLQKSTFFLNFLSDCVPVRRCCYLL